MPEGFLGELAFFVISVATYMVPVFFWGWFFYRLGFNKGQAQVYKEWTNEQLAKSKEAEARGRNRGVLGWHRS